MNSHQYNPDCGYAWIICGACFIINFVMAGLQRAAGVLYIALIDEYSVSRQVATAPFSLRFCVRNMAGPVVGLLGQRFGIRKVVLLGALISGVGGIICSIAPNINWIIIAWGGVHGLGYGMCNIIHVIVLNRYFDKYKGLALGICLTGDCFGTFLLPVLLEFLLYAYGLKGTFLILAGISLNLVPAAMILKSPPWEIESKKPMPLTDNKSEIKTERLNNCIFENKGFEHTEGEFFGNTKENEGNLSYPQIILSGAENKENDAKQCFHSPVSFEKKFIQGHQTEINQHFDAYSYENIVNKQKLAFNQASSLRLSNKPGRNYGRRHNFPVYDTNRKNSTLSVLSCPTPVRKSSIETLCKNIIADHVFIIPTSPYSQNQQTKDDFKIVCKDKSLTRDMDISDAFICSAVQKSSSLPYKEQMASNFLINDAINSDVDKSVESNCDTTTPTKENAFKLFIKTNLKPTFLLICIDMALYVFLFISVFTIIFDYASDNGIPSEYGKFLVIAFSVTDVVGRIGFGIVLDSRWIPVHYYAGLTTGLMGLLIFIMPFSKTFMFWMISFSACGLIQGGVAIMYPILVEHYMEKNEETVALGCLNFYGGLLMLPVPHMIGYFRDTVGTYDGVFWTTGALCVLGGCLWLLEPWLLRMQHRKRII